MLFAVFQTSNFSGVYDNIGGSAAQEIRQRLQVIQPNITPLSSTGPFYPRSYALDDEESLPSDTPGDERCLAKVLICPYVSTVKFEIQDMFVISFSICCTFVVVCIYSL